jgi:hypothetical protein
MKECLIETRIDAEAGIRFWIQRIWAGQHVPQPLLARKADGEWEVVDGRKRIAAYARLYGKGHEVPALEVKGSEEQIEKLKRELNRPPDKLRDAIVDVKKVRDGNQAASIRLSKSGRCGAQSPRCAVTELDVQRIWETSVKALEATCLSGMPA